MNTFVTSNPPNTRVPSLLQLQFRRMIPVLVIMPTIALILSGLITWINVGLTPDFGLRWLKAFGMALPVLPIGLITMGLLQRLTQPIVSKVPDWVTKTLLALGTAMAMETLMASAVTFSTHGFANGFAAQWRLAFVGSLPAGILIGLTMAFVIRPRLARWMGSV